MRLVCKHSCQSFKLFNMFKLLVIHMCCGMLLLIVEGSIGQQRGKYRGCYEFHPQSSLVSNFVDHFEKTLTPTFCVNICAQRNFAFAGLDNYECRCGQHEPTDILKRSDSECNHLCPGNRTATCGGKSKVSVYETGVKNTQFILSRIYLGCFKDANPEFRVLKGSATSFEDNSPEKCHHHCHDTGFKYFGLTYIKECFCGDTAPEMDTALPESECDTRCSGDASQFCGGGWKLSLYATGITDMAETGRFVGCYKDFRNSEIKPDLKIELTKSNSNRRCMNVCQGRGFKFSGIQDKIKCGCMNSIPPLVFIDKESSCDKNECVGDITETCGSKDRVKIFRTRHGDSLREQEPSRLGCFQDQAEYRVLDGVQVTGIEKLTPSLCIEICKIKGFAFAGVELGNECHCGHSYPTPYTGVQDTECRMPCNGSVSSFCGGVSTIFVYDTGLPHSQARVSKWYMGCYQDDKKDNRMLKGSWQDLQNNSPDICHKRCLKTGFLYFGLTWIRECFCGDEDPADSLKVPETECSKECGGDSTKKCGGGWRLSVYRTGLSEILHGGTYEGCFNDDGSLLAENKRVLTTANKPTRCANICDQLGYLYAGVGRGTECRCGFKQPLQKQLADDSLCNIQCPGDASETCGGNNHVKVYRTTVKEEVTTVTHIDTALIRGDHCKASNTSKNGKSVCKAEKLFDEPFNSLKSSTWKYTIKMAPEPDLEFATYSSSQEVTFVKNGVLHIRPRVQTEDYVYGKDTLKDCTGTPDSDECSRERVGFNILPPVLSGQITTERSFSFRYGRVDIKAKLPSGDWIVPQIWLSPRDSIYGPDYESGQIRIAMARGNKNLVCNGKKLGNNILETGIYFGLPNAVQHYTFTRDIPEGWSQKFHDFGLVWSPDNLSFYVDEKLVASILKQESVDTIGSVTKSANNVKYLWQEGSKLAPFDKEFYITLGVSVGGITDFADNCTSNSVKIPWSNGSPKAMYNFWLKNNDWSTTWVGDDAALQVDHIKVEAI